MNSRDYTGIIKLLEQIYKELVIIRKDFKTFNALNADDRGVSVNFKPIGTFNY